MKEVVLDTETTGLDPEQDRIVEIGCVELENQVPSGRTWHSYCNPGKGISAEAEAVHGLTGDFLSEAPVFGEIVESFLSFVGSARLVIHNAEFDVAFLNMELERLGLERIPMERVLDTLDLARSRHPNSSVSLDALCKRYGIDTSLRKRFHGAFLDAKLLSEVYGELCGGRQSHLDLMEARHGERAGAWRDRGEVSVRSVPYVSVVGEKERVAHRTLVSGLGEKAVWNLYDETRTPEDAGGV